MKCYSIYHYDGDICVAEHDTLKEAREFHTNNMERIASLSEMRESIRHNGCYWIDVRDWSNSKSGKFKARPAGIVIIQGRLRGPGTKKGRTYGQK